MSSFSHRTVVISAIILAGMAIAADHPGAATVPITSVKYSDLTNSIQIIGELGFPLGKIATIRGRWHENSTSKDPQLSFRVTSADGKAIDPNIELLSENVQPVPLRGEKDPSKSRSVWDWSAAWNTHMEPPKPTAGEEWEMQVVAEGGIVGFPTNVRDELGRGPAQRSY